MSLYIYSCDNTHTKNKSENSSTQTTGLSTLNGFWILSDYTNSIIQSKSIEKHRHKRLTWSSLILQIKKDSLIHYGLVYGNKKIALNYNPDSLGVIMNNYQLKFLEKENIINVKYIGNNEIDSNKYSFRRLNKWEQRLVKNINKSIKFNALKPNFHSFYIDSLISGIYTPLEEINSSLKLNSNGTTTGFKNYNKYIINDCFGTHHPYSPEDVIIFENTTIENNEIKPPENIGVYSWVFKSDTLILTKMITENYERYVNGTEKYKFIKSPSKLLDNHVNNESPITEKSFYPSGKLQKIIEYKEDEIGCKFKIYHPNGNLKTEAEQGEFAGCGIQVGTEMNYDTTGLLIQKKEFEHFLPKDANGCHETRTVITITDYFSDGNIKKNSQIETCYECDECPCGTWKYFDKKGKQLNSEKFGDCYDFQLDCLD